MDTNREALFYNSLASSSEHSYTRLRRIREEHSNWEKAWEKTGTASRRNPEKAWEALRKEGVRLILLEDPDYPPLLKEIPWPPFGIYVKGNLPMREARFIAIVGTRKATGEGRELAREFGKGLGAAGAIVTSGLALGIDRAAHEGCLEGKGTTIAVLAHGLDRVYPRHHENLADRILANGGALISEYPLGSPTLPYRFLERNRIVSGLSEGSLVVEAPEGSGSLATARFALEQNRSVFVVPGPATHPNFRGSHELIRSGAELVTMPEHILESLGMLAGSQNSLETNFSDEEQKIVDLLKKTSKPLLVDKIIEDSNLDTQVVTRILSFLLLRNAIKETERGFTL